MAETNERMQQEIGRLNALLDAIADMAREGQTPDATLLSFADARAPGVAADAKGLTNQGNGGEE